MIALTSFLITIAGRSRDFYMYRRRRRRAIVVSNIDERCGSGAVHSVAIHTLNALKTTAPRMRAPRIYMTHMNHAKSAYVVRHQIATLYTRYI